MNQPALADAPPAIVVRHEKLSASQVEEILQEPNGASALIVMLRDDKVDLDLVIEAITRMQNNKTENVKRFVVALVDAIFPG